MDPNTAKRATVHGARIEGRFVCNQLRTKYSVGTRYSEIYIFFRFLLQKEVSRGHDAIHGWHNIANECESERMSNTM
jgi:hypothetical protein